MLSITHLIHAALALALIAVPSHAAPPRCTPGSSDIRVRKEWRTLSATEKASYFKGFDAIIASGFYDELANTHNGHNNYIHGNPLFLPWHRAFTVIVEVEMRKTAGPQFALPYWDWGYDSQSPELAPIWGDNPDQFGRGSGCVTTGHFAGRKPRYPSRSCLRRNFNSEMEAVVGTPELNRILTGTRTYLSFWRALESTPHSAVHVGIGGDMQVMYSPNDPVFFLHHAMVDKVWADWQKLRNGANKNLYEGDQRDYRADLNFGRAGKHPATVQDVLYPYSDWKVADTFDTEVLCFKYADLNNQDVALDGPLPPTTVTPGPGTQPTQPPSRPPNTQPTGGSSGGRRRDDDDEDRHSHNPFKKIGDFFDKLLNEGAVDPSQAPAGQAGAPRQVAPVDDKVQLGFDEKAAAQDVPTTDRTELVKLRKPARISDEWIALNGLDATAVRSYEKEAEDALRKLNNVFGYVAPCALWNQPHKVAALAKKDAKNFKVTLSSVVVTVENSVEKAAKDAKQAVVDIQARVKLSIGFKHIQNIDKVTPQVTKIIGENVYSKDYAGNPFRPRQSA